MVHISKDTFKKKFALGGAKENQPESPEENCLNIKGVTQHSPYYAYPAISVRELRNYGKLWK